MMKRLILALFLLCAVPVLAQTSVAVGTFQTGTGTTPVEVNIAGAFTPTVVFIITSAPGDGTNNNHTISFGALTNQTTDQQFVAWAGCAQAVDPSDCNQDMISGRAVAVYNGGTTLVGDMSCAIDADGFTCTPVDAFPNDTTIGYVAIGGDVNDAAMGSITLPTSTGNFTVCSSGCTKTVAELDFEPDFLLLFGTRQTGLGSPQAQAFFNIGYTDGTNAALNSTEGVDAQDASDVRSYARSAASQLELYAVTQAAAAVANRVSFVDFNANGGGTGATLNTVETDGTAHQVIVVALKGGRWHVGDLLSATSITSIAETGAGFQPKGVFLNKTTALGGQSTSDTSIGGLGTSFGAAISSTARFAMQTAAGDNAAANDNYTNHQATDKISLRYTGAGVLQGDIDFTSLDADGFTLAQEDADPAQLFCIYFVVGDNAAAGTAARRKVIIQ